MLVGIGSEMFEETDVMQGIETESRRQSMSDGGVEIVFHLGQHVDGPCQSRPPAEYAADLDFDAAATTTNPPPPPPVGFLSVAPLVGLHRSGVILVGLCHGDVLLSLGLLSRPGLRDLDPLPMPPCAARHSSGR